MMRRLLLVIALILLLADIVVFHGSYTVKPFQGIATVSPQFPSSNMQRLAEWEASLSFDPFMVGGGLLILAVLMKSIFGSCSRGGVAV